MKVKLQLIALLFFFVWPENEEIREEPGFPVLQAVDDTGGGVAEGSTGFPVVSRCCLIPQYPNWLYTNLEHFWFCIGLTINRESFRITKTRGKEQISSRRPELKDSNFMKTKQKLHRDPP